jgi:hypothetical protein
MLRISKEEKKIQFVYLLALWLIFSFVFCYVCFFNYSKSEVRSKEIVIEKINQQNVLLKSQYESVAHVDSLCKMLLLYQPSTSQVYLENNITFELEELKKIYEAKKGDEEYKIFNQLYVFNSMQFYDKRATWNATNNSAFLKKNLEECEIGFQQKQDNLNIKNALSQGDKK